MTPLLPVVGGDTLVVSPTQLEEMKTCPRRWLYRYLYRRVRAVPNAAAVGGKAFDSALNHRYTKLGARKVDEATEAEMLALIDAAYEGVELPLEEYRTAARYKEVVQAYNAYWGAEPFEVLGVQVPFAVELGSVPMPWQNSIVELPGMSRLSVIAKRVRVVLHGLLDIFVRAADHILIADTKTAKTWRNDPYANSGQMKAYCWALQELARLHPDKGLPPKVHGAFINAVVIRPPYKSESYAKRPNAAPRNEFLRPMPAFFTPERLEEWRLDTLLWVEQALGWVARDHFPQNEKVCPLHYGYPCGYLSTCTLPKDQREMSLASDEYMDYDKGPLQHLTDELGETS